jgi:hypothetical protein
VRLIFATAFLLLLCGCGKPRPPEASLISESKTKAFRVSIVELPVWDRNFEVWIERTNDGSKTLIFKSPDEGLPGTERIMWRRDHSQFVIVGRNFIVDDSPQIPMDVLYLLYDIPTGKMWCNAAQAAGERFTMQNLKDWDGSYENDVFRRPVAK